MKNVFLAAVFILIVCGSPQAQSDIRKISVRVILVDNDLNQKPVPHLALVLATADSNHSDISLQAKTDFGGNAEFQAPPGNYRVATPQGVDFQGHHYAWEIEINVSEAHFSLDLSNDNARITDLPSTEPARKMDDLTSMFQKYQKSVEVIS